jgi:hypothetical protein
MTPAGRKLVRPSPEHPAYYLPVMSGFEELGARAAHGEKAPPDAHVAKLISEALARQGYLLAHPQLAFNAKHEVIYADGATVDVPDYPTFSNRPIALNQPRSDPLTQEMLESPSGPYSVRAAIGLGRDWMRLPLIRVLRGVHPTHGPVMQQMPSLVIVVHWGDALPGGQGTAPVILQTTDTGGGMIGLIAGNTFSDLSIYDQQTVILRMHLDRYFVTVSAYDFQSMYLRDKPVLLWSAKMTVPSNDGSELDPLLPVLIAAGEDHFGRESTRPELRTVELSEGKVIIGKPRVVGDDSADDWSKLKPLDVK